MKYLFKTISALFVCLLLSGCGGGHDRAGSGERAQTLSVMNWPTEQTVNEDDLYSYIPQIDTSMKGGISFTVENLPEWAEFNSQTGEISGVPSNEYAGEVYSSITIHLTSNGQDISVGPFDIKVVAINDAPTIESQQMEVVKQDLGYQGELTFNDEDTPLSQLRVEISRQPEHAYVSPVSGTKSFIVTPSSIEAFKERISFGVKIYDDALETPEVDISVSLIDPSEFTLSTNINDGFSLADPNYIALSSSHPVELIELSGNSEAGDCSGTVNVSADDFASCIPLTIRVTSALNTQFRIEGEFNADQLYKIKLEKGVSSVFNKTFNIETIESFNILNHLVISEISGSFHTDTARWLELYNPTREAINLSDYAIETDAIRLENEALDQWQRLPSKLFSLPDQTILPGQYIVIRSQNFHELRHSERNVIYLGDNIENPYWWNEGGAVELVKLASSGNQTVDYAGFGEPFHSQSRDTYSLNSWSGPFIQALDAGGSAAEGGSWNRSAVLGDSNTANDWYLSETATPGGPNDVLCNIDGDMDGIPDCSEEAGSTFSGIDLYSMGARVNQQDIFVEIDYMESQAPEITPRKEALQKVRDAFLKKGIHVHFDVGSLYSDNVFNLGGGNQIPFSECIKFEPSESCVSIYDVKAEHFNLSRLFSFHYFVFANSVNTDGSAGPGGRAEILGNDGVITLGGWDLSSDNEVINQQAVTLMHELGHNLGLEHGGNTDQNYKPNYLSVMNYLYANDGLPEIGNNEGDRFYIHYDIWMNSTDCSSVELTNPVWGNHNEFVIDFSNGSSVDINENAIDESVGLGRIGSSSVDFNCNSISENATYRQDVSLDNIRSIRLSDYDDWSNLELRFNRYWSGNNHGPTPRNIQNDDSIRFNLYYDQTRLADEPSLGADFFQRRAQQKRFWQASQN